MLLGAIAAIILATVMVYVETNANANRVVLPTPMDGIPCGPGQDAYHEHAHLTILDAGQSVAPPGDIGRPSSIDCVYWLHTHDTDGIIHIEAPQKFRATLGEFFDIWHKPLSRTQVGDSSVSGTQRMRVYVNQRLYRGNPRHILLRPYADITIEIGPPFSPPTKYSFAGY